MSDKMPLSEIRRILERGEWWDNVRDVSPDEPCPWLDELNGAIEAALDELQAYHDAEVSGKFLQAGDVVCDSDIGKYVWLTREEAEAALEELEARYARTTDKAQS